LTLNDIAECQNSRIAGMETAEGTNKETTNRRVKKRERDEEPGTNNDGKRREDG
jgi:hypothetical protein